MSFLENNFFLLAITFGIFFFAKLLQKKTGLVLLNPILLTIALLIIFLKMTNISYDPVICNVKDRCIWIFINSNDHIRR